MPDTPTSKYEPVDLATYIEGHDFRPMAGHCLLRLDKKPDTIGSIHVPESARDLQIDNKSHTGTVLAMEPRRGWAPADECFRPGDRVIAMLLLEDLTRTNGIVLTDNRRIYAVVE